MKTLSVRIPYSGPDTSEQAVVGHCDMPLTKAQPECSLGNFLADAMLAASRKIDPKVVAAISNYGAIRLDYLPPGPITRGQIKQLMPFDNVLVVLEIPGKQLQQLCSRIVERKGWPVSGLSFTIRNGKAEKIQVGDSPLDEELLYKVVVNSYLSKGGDGCDFLVGLPARRSRVLVRNALLDFLTNLEQKEQVLHPAIGQRIRYAE